MVTSKSQAKSIRSLFWRLWLRSLTVKRPQAALGIASVAVGAAVAAMLLNLYGDARHKMTEEFRAYGANVIVAPQGSAGNPAGPARLMSEDVMSGIRSFQARVEGLAAAPVLYVVARARAAKADPRLAAFENAVIVGTDFDAWRKVEPSWKLAGIGARIDPARLDACVAGAHIASLFRLGVGDSIELEPMTEKPGDRASERRKCKVSAIVSTGASEDDQVFLPLATLQKEARLERKISLVELSVPGARAEVERTVGELRRRLPGVEVRPIRQIVYSSGRILDTIRWLLVSLTGLIVMIIALCVAATMTAIVLERRKDIAVMKALGASDGLVMRLFLSEGAALGLVGGLAGFVAGVALAREMAERLFGVRLGVVWWTLPAITFGCILLAMVASAFPVKIVRRVQPAAVLRGE